MVNKIYNSVEERRKVQNKRFVWKSHMDAIVAYGGKCACCGEDRPEFLGIDHINGGGNKHRKEEGIHSLSRWLRKNKYPEGFRVLCHNCNISIGSYGYCPHTGAKHI